MKKIYSLLVLMLLGMSAVWAEEVTFGPDFSTGKWTAVTADQTYSMTSGDITLTVDKGESTTPVTQGQTAQHLRVYKNASLTISSAGGNITAVEFTIAGSYPATRFAVNGTLLTDNSWSGDAASVTFVAADGQVRASAIKVTYGEGGGSGYKAPTILINGEAPAASYLQSELPLTLSIQDNNNSTNYRFAYAINGDVVTGASSGYVSTSHELNLGDRPVLDLVLGANTIQVLEYVDWDNQAETKAPVASVTINVVGSVSSVAAFNALDDGATIAFSGPLTAIAQKNNYLYAQDASHGILIYGSVGQTYELGNVIPAGFSGKKTTYKGAPEMAAPLAGFEAATSTVLVEPIEISAADLTVDNAFRYAVIKNAVVASGAVKDANGAAVNVYNRFDVNAPADGTYNITGVTGWYDGAQFMPLEYEATGDTPQPTLYAVHIDDGMVYGTVSANPMEAAAGATITLTITPDNGYKLSALEVKDATGAPIEYSVGTTENVYTFEMPASDAYVSATFEEEGGTPAEHELTYAIIGVTGNTYTAWTGIGGGTSDAVYAGKTAGGNNAIQMRSNGSDCGIVTTTSAGLVKSVTIAWNENTAADGRTVQIYGKNTAYSSAADLYGDNKGDLLGEISSNENTLMVTVDGDYAYWGIRSKSSALYLDAIDVVWQEGEVPETVEKPVISGETPFEESTTVSITCATEGAEIHYYVGADRAAMADDPVYTEPFTITESCTVSAIAVKGELVSEVATMAFEKAEPVAPIMSVAEFNALEDNAEATFGVALTAIAQVGKYLYAQDENNGILIYGEIGQTYELGNVIPAGFSGKKTTYKGAPEMAAPLAGFEAATSTVLVAPIEIMAADLTLENAFRYAIVKDAVVAEGKLYDANGAELPLFTGRFNVELPADGTYNVIGVTGWYNNAQFMPLVFETVEPEPHAIILDVEGQGQILVGDGLTEALAGTDVSFRVIGDEGWRCDVNNDLHVTYLGVDDEPVEIGLSYWTTGDEEGYSFVMPDADVTISAVFEQYLYNIVKDVTVGGDVEVQETADAGALIFFTAVPAEHYELYQIVITYEDETGEPVNVDYQAEEAENTYSFFMPAADVNLLVEFAELPLYGITVQAENATVAVAESAHEGDNVEFSVAASAGYVVKNVSASYIAVDGESDVPQAIELSKGTVEGAYVFTMPAGRVTIVVETEMDLPHLAFGDVQEQGEVGKTYYIDSDIAIYAEGVTVAGIGSMYFATDNDGNYLPICVPSTLAKTWPKAGLGAGFKAMVYALRGQKVLVFVDGEEIDVEYVVDEQAVNRVFVPVDYKVYRLRGYVQEVDGQMYLSEFSGKNGSIQASCHLVTDNVSLEITDFNQDHPYEFIAVPALKSVYNGAPQRAQSDLQKYEFVVISSQVSVITGIESLNADDAVSVTYVNMQGAVSNRPFDGVNIVVTQHADGSVTTVKVLR
ncbi:MAG: chitobiase/beta-hexosaminidase C-terminal domain-containing protein [Muribaculaceae bacterium]|nr:chitobiase/beta-hexosaminidase C-terminal domain-containing protein [Muribaculaceae bacterium]